MDSINKNMFKRVFCLIVLVFTTTVFAQSYTKHTVAKGETIASIAQKYKVTPFDIYKVNPDAKNGIQPSAVLLIPKTTQIAPKPAASTTPKTKLHEVVTGDTKYSIAKKYGVTVEELEKLNPEIKDNLPLGFQVRLNATAPKTTATVTDKPKSATTSVSIHEVIAGDTKYSIAKKYGISVEDLEKQNPEIVSNLPIGYKLIIKGTAPKLEKIESQKVPSTPSFSEGNNKVEINFPDFALGDWIIDVASDKKSEIELAQWLRSQAT